MKKNLSLTTLIPALLLIGASAYILTRRFYVNRGGYCEVDEHWWFGTWVRCKGGERCTSHCELQWRRKGTEEHWATVDIVPGGSVAKSDDMEYRCVCA